MKPGNRLTLNPNPNPNPNDLIKINLIARKVRIFESESVKDLNCINLTGTLRSKGLSMICKLIHFPNHHQSSMMLPELTS